MYFGIISIPNYGMISLVFIREFSISNRSFKLQVTYLLVTGNDSTQIISLTQRLGSLPTDLNCFYRDADILRDLLPGNDDIPG